MRIIFDNGEVADLENVHTIVVNNSDEFDILNRAVDSYFESELKSLDGRINKIKEDLDELTGIS